MDEYAKLADQFNPTNFDAKAWVAIAKSAAMKYMVLTTRHHDGFALFDDPGSNFTSVKTAAHRFRRRLNGDESERWRTTRNHASD